MVLNINSPSYYTEKFGIIDEIYNLCKNIRKEVKDKTYSNIVDTIGIVPIIAPDIIDIKETKKYSLTYGFVFVSLKIDYNKFVYSNIEQKKKLIIENILLSIKVIHKKAKIDYKQFELDIIEYCRTVGIVLKDS